jgi:hypothetical protein
MMAQMIGSFRDTARSLDDLGVPQPGGPFGGARGGCMSRFAFPDLVRAFCDGERFGDSTMRVVEADPLVLPSGRVVACDPTYLLNGPRPAYTRPVPPGRYPVLLALLNTPALLPDHPNYEHVACAMLRLGDWPIQRWEMALRPGWDPRTLKPGYHLGYGVDGGKGCFVDEQAVARVPSSQPAFYQAHERALRQVWEAYQRMQANPSEAPQREMAECYGEGFREAYRAIVPSALGEVLGVVFDPDRLRQKSWSAVLDPESGANLVSFFSGHGDGCYASYFGLTAEGEAVCLVTDFGLLVRSVPDTLEIPVPAREHSELIHPGLADAGVDCAHLEWNPSSGQVVLLFEGSRYLQEVRFENRPGSAVRCTASGCTGRDEAEGRDWFFQLEEPLQPTARVLIEYTLRTEAL